MRPVLRHIARYEILQRLGEGGMGALYLARDPSIDRLVAVKLLHSHLGRGELHERFVREARAAGALTHPNIVTIYDFGEFEDSPFIVMEYVRGETLAEIIKRKAQVPLTRKLRWLEGMCAGLAYAHSSRIIHRDIKPQNLMVDERDTLKILDFGIARFAESGLTKASMQIGTPGYMSPEQVEGGAIDQRSDIFSSGAVAYELFGYREAFGGDTVGSILNRVLRETPPPLATVCQDLDPAVEDIVHRALQKDPAARFQDMDQMRRQLERVRVRLDAVNVDTRPMTPPAAAAPERRPKSRTDQAAIARRRAEQIAQQLSKARDELTAGNDAEVETACEAVLLLDPENAEAQQLLEQVRAQTEATVSIEPLLTGAKEALSNGAFTAAEELIERAAERGASPDELSALREQVKRARADRDRLRWRAQGVRSALDRAQASAKEGAREAALRYVEEALALDPENAEALELKRSWAPPLAVPAAEGPRRSPPPAPPAPPSPVQPVKRPPVATMGLAVSAVVVLGLLAYFSSSARTPDERTATQTRVAVDTGRSGVSDAPTAKPTPSGEGQGASGPGTITAPGGADVSNDTRGPSPAAEGASEADKNGLARAGAGSTGPVAKAPTGGVDSPNKSAPVNPADDRANQARQIERQMAQASQFETNGRLAESLRQYEAILRLEPAHRAAAEGRERVITAIADRRARARDLVRKADQLYQAAEYDAAIAELRKALELAPDDPEARGLLASVEKGKATEEAFKKRPPGR